MVASENMFYLTFTFFTLLLGLGFSVGQGCQTQFLEGHSPAEFSSNPD